MLRLLLWSGAFTIPAGAESGPSSWAKPASYHRILVRRPDVSNIQLVEPGHPKDVDD